MNFVSKLYGNTYAVHVTVALVGVATLNLALPAPPGSHFETKHALWRQIIANYFGNKLIFNYLNETIEEISKTFASKMPIPPMIMLFIVFSHHFEKKGALAIKPGQ